MNRTYTLHDDTVALIHRGLTDFASLLEDDYPELAADYEAAANTMVSFHAELRGASQ